MLKKILLFILLSIQPYAMDKDNPFKPDPALKKQTFSTVAEWAEEGIRRLGDLQTDQGKVGRIIYMDTIYLDMLFRTEAKKEDITAHLHYIRQHSGNSLTQRLGGWLIESSTVNLPCHLRTLKFFDACKDTDVAGESTFTALMQAYMWACTKAADLPSL